MESNMMNPRTEEEMAELHAAVDRLDAKQPVVSDWEILDGPDPLRPGFYRDSGTPIVCAD